ncbi:MAG: hypothetical protein AB7V43_02295 [Acidimicrobiia bacterium]
MRTRMSALAVLALTVSMVACGDGGETTQTTASATTTTMATATTATTGTTLAPEQLQAMLLAAADVGSGWKEGSPVNEMDFADSMKFPCADMGLNPTILARITPTVGVQFEPVDGSYKHMIEMMVSGEPTRLNTDLGFYFEGMQACAASTVTSTTTSAGDQLTLKDFALPAIGDQRMATVGTGRESADSDALWCVRSAVVRVGSVAVMVGVTEILSGSQTTPTISDADFVKLVTTAVERVGS